MDAVEKSSVFVNEMDWFEVPAKCPDCKNALHVAGGQEVAFCPFCAIDKENARRGREVMQRFEARRC